MQIVKVKSYLAFIAITSLANLACYAQKDVPASLKLTPSYPQAKSDSVEGITFGQGSLPVCRSALDAMVERIRPELDSDYTRIIVKQQDVLKMLKLQREQYQTQLNRSNLRVPRSGEAVSGDTKSRTNLLALISETDRKLRKVELKIADMKTNRKLNTLAIAWFRLSQQQHIEILDSDCLSASEKAELLKGLVISNAENPHMEDFGR